MSVATELSTLDGTEYSKLHEKYVQLFPAAVIFHLIGETINPRPILQTYFWDMQYDKSTWATVYVGAMAVYSIGSAVSVGCLYLLSFRAYRNRNRGLTISQVTSFMFA